MDGQETGYIHFLRSKKRDRGHKFLIPIVEHNGFHSENYFVLRDYLTVNQD
jgi:hypothetical protein